MVGGARSAKASKAGASGGEGELVMTAQQSRFHADALDAPESKEVSHLPKHGVGMVYSS